MQLLRAASTDVTQPGGFREVEVVVGLAGGAQVGGWLRLHGTWRVDDLLNNVREPMLTLGVGPQGSARGSLTLSRGNIAWIASLQSDPAGNGDNDTRGVQAEHAVVVHVGPFELCGTITTYQEVQWSNFLVGRLGPPAEFFVLSGARMANNTELPASSVAVNVALVAALASAN